MDDINAVDNFFQEIDQIASGRNEDKSDDCWQECLDKYSGCIYYWNTSTDEVSWNKPIKYVPLKDVKLRKKELRKPNTTNMSKSLQLPHPLPPTHIKPSHFKIYSIQQMANKEQKKTKHIEKTCRNKNKRRSSSSEDEQIELITSYGSSSESNEEDLKNDNDNIINKIQSKSTLDIKKIDSQQKVAKNENFKLKSNETTKNHVTGISLIAGYSDSEEENEDVKEPFKHKQECSEKEKDHSNFSRISPVDKKDISDEKIEKIPSSVENNDFDPKIFKRKRRIVVSLPVTMNSQEIQTSLNNTNNAKAIQKSVLTSKENLYSGFMKGEVMFLNEESNSSCHADVTTPTKESLINKKEVEDTYVSLKEKLIFLCEGRESMPPIQIMKTQGETLCAALKADSLKPDYFHNWLKETITELRKLEQEAAPTGWVLQWDRLQKRYYYQHEVTGESQWEYPQSDITVTDDNMDISTTPPPLPPSDDTETSPRLLPTPPPPPIISEVQSNPSTDTTLPSPVPETKLVNNGEPLPPGVDLPEMVDFDSSDQKDEKKIGDVLSSALDSFYSEIATSTEVLTCSQPCSPSLPETQANTICNADMTKKRKKKAKLTPGLSMKNKGVSQLVEKWKNVQKSYNEEK